MKNILKNNFIYIFIAITLSIYTLLYNTIDMDYWARLLQGNAFWQLGHILKQDPFSYTQTHLWLDHEWGSSVIFSAIQNLFGFNGILVFKTILLFLMFFLIFKTIRLIFPKRNFLLEALIFMASVVSMPTILQSGLRCHFFTFFFFTLFIYICEFVRRNKNYKLLAILPFIIVFWVNIHGGCVSGLGLLLMYAIGEFLNKKPFKYFLYALTASTAVMFINPYGFDYVKFIFTASTMQRPFVTEWISPFAHPDLTFMLYFKIFFTLSAVIFLMNLKSIKKDYTKFIIVAMCLFVSFKYVKNTPFAIIAFSIFFYEEIANAAAKISEKVAKKIKITNVIQNKEFYFIVPICCLFIFGVLNQLLELNKFKTLENSFLCTQPVKVTEFIKINNLQGKILSPFDMGSYLAYKLYPNILIYMDGRYEEVYFDETKELLDNFYNVQKDGYKILSGDSKPDFIVVPANALINDYLVTLDNYKLIYSDENEFLYSSAEKLKPKYLLPPNDTEYYLHRAFERMTDKPDNFVVK